MAEAQAGNGNKLQALADSVGMSLTYKAAVIFVTVIALPFGLWLGNRIVSNMDTMAMNIQAISERLVRVETKLEYRDRSE